MKVLHCNSFKSGGAARAAERICNAVKTAGVDSSMLWICGDNEEESLAWRFYDRLLHKFYIRINNSRIKRPESRGLFSFDELGFDLTKVKKAMDADIIHFHWISDGFVSLSSLHALSTLGKPVVWTMHDMCPFTGGCHISKECTAYEGSCGNCPVLESKKSRDLSSGLQEKKRKAISGMRLFPVGCSSWITECAGKSSLFGPFDPVNIPNPINTGEFNIIDKKTARELLSLPKRKKLVLFGAFSADTDDNKGFKELCEALKMLPENDYACAVFGNDRDISDKTGLETISLGRINDDFHLKVLYNAADVYVCPSKQENLPNTILEALSCGTPVAAFDTGGIKDMVKHMENGYLAPLGNIEELSQGIRFSALTDLREAARKSVIVRFSYEAVGRRYKELYETVLGR